MRKRFSDWKPTAKTVDRASQALDIVEEYMGAGLRLTLRQLYYQFVARDLIPNSDREYKKLGALVSNLRMGGYLDWDAIEDRNRVPDVPSQWPSIQALAETAARAYRLPRWEGQRGYVELWVEKAALAGVLEPLASEFHVVLMVNRGYSSQSAMYESARRIRELGNGRPSTVLYIGDHDPSGQDMVRDIGERLVTFLEGDVELSVRCIALTTAQVEQYDPPPNPTKLSDSRADGYIDRHGHECWEVDALEPSVLQDIVRSEISARVNKRKMDAVIRREQRDRVNLLKAVGAL